MNIDCAGCAGNPHACDGCSIGLLLGPVVSVTSYDAPDPGTAAESVIAEEASAAEMTEAIAVFAATGMLAGLRSVPDAGDVRAGRGGAGGSVIRRLRAG